MGIPWWLRERCSGPLETKEEIAGAVRRLRELMEHLANDVQQATEGVDGLRKKVQGNLDWRRSVQEPGSGIPTWGTRPSYFDSAAEGGGGYASNVVDLLADELYLHDHQTDATGRADPHGLTHEMQHFPIAQQPLPDRGDDIVRRAPGHHITHTVGANMVNTAGHLDVSKLGAAVSHNAPKLDASKTAAGTMNPTQIDEEATTFTVTGSTGLAYNQISRVAFDPAESGGPNLYAFYRVKDDDQKGHAASLSAETRKEIYAPPWGSALNQMWLWGGSSTKYQTVAAPTASSQVLFYVGGSIGWVAASFASEVEGGAVPSAVIPDKNKGWIYKYARSSVVEIAHADPRNETVYKPPDSACYPFPACDARGHTIGWWYKTAPSTWAWNSPWGFGDPGMP